MTRCLVQDDVLHVRLDLFDPIKIFFRKLDGIFRVILELYLTFVGGEVLTTSKSVGNACFTLLLPATGITLDRRAVRVRFADNLDPFGIAGAVNA